MSAKVKQKQKKKKTVSSFTILMSYCEDFGFVWLITICTLASVKRLDAVYRKNTESQ